MTDLVIDTNSLVILDNEDTLEFIIQNNDVVYVPRCVIRDEFPRVFRHLIGFQQNIERGIQRLRTARPKRFHEVNPKVNINQDLEKVLKQNGADACDRDLVKLCKERKERKSDVKIITTNKRHFQEIHKLRQCCTMIYPEDYPPSFSAS